MSSYIYQLGELNEWSKKTNTELATHIPLIIRVPWITQSTGARTTVKIELVDLLRTGTSTTCIVLHPRKLTRFKMYPDDLN